MAKKTILRHKLVDRIFHWSMAVCIFILLGTGLLPVVGLKFSWVTVHWIAGVVLTGCIVLHIIRSLFWKKFTLIWISIRDIMSGITEIKAPGSGKKPGKYSLEQKLMHHAVTLFSLCAIGTGIVMMVKIDTPFWERDPYWLSADVWGGVYVLHGLSSLCFISLIMLHIYFALRPEKRMYLRSMVLGWITREEHQKNHSMEEWPAEQSSEAPIKKDKEII